MITRQTFFKPRSLTCSFTLAIALSFWSNSALAGDPFRTNNVRNIGEKTEDAFNALFREGNYQNTKQYLNEAESSDANEPLVYALQASLSYTEKDWEALKNYATKTLKTAQELQKKDPLRGNLYTAVGHFLEGTYTFKKEGPFDAIPKLQQVFQYLDEAEEINNQDPELNLIKGYMDLILAVNLPFSNPNQAIDRLEDYASPTYLVNRGIALAYRDLQQYDQALQFVEKSLAVTPNNPELYYLRGQILYKKGKENRDISILDQALNSFDKALKKADQLPNSIVKPLRRERRIAKQRIDSIISE